MARRRPECGGPQCPARPAPAAGQSGRGAGGRGGASRPRAEAPPPRETRARGTERRSRGLRRAPRGSRAPGGEAPPPAPSHPAASVAGLGVLGTYAIALKGGRQAESPRSALPARTLSTQTRSACSRIPVLPGELRPPTQAVPSEGALRHSTERCREDHVKTCPRASRVQGSLETSALRLGRSPSAVQRGPPALGPAGEKGPLSAGTGCAGQPLP